MTQRGAEKRRGAEGRDREARSAAAEKKGLPSPECRRGAEPRMQARCRVQNADTVVSPFCAQQDPGTRHGKPFSARLGGTGLPILALTSRFRTGGILSRLTLFEGRDIFCCLNRRPPRGSSDLSAAAEKKGLPSPECRRGAEPRMQTGSQAQNAGAVPSPECRYDAEPRMQTGSQAQNAGAVVSAF